MKPILELSGGRYDFVKELIELHSMSVEGDAHEVILGDGTRELVVLGADKLHGSQKMVDGLENLLTGGDFLMGKHVDSSTIPDETNLRDFLNNPRLAGVLSRCGNLKTLGDLREFLKTNALEDLDAVRGIGPESVATVRAALGR